jgi:hypothetical protein
MMRSVFAVALTAFSITLHAGCSDQDTRFTLAAATAQATGSDKGPAKSTSWAESLGRDDAMKQAAGYHKLCAGEAAPSTRCEILRSLVVANVSTTLELIERSRDQRGVEQAMAALAFPDEPDIFIPACRILGRFPTTPGIVEKVLPHLLENKYVEIQRMAATLLARTEDPGARQAGELWLHNHQRLSPEGTYDEYPDFPAHYTAIGFPKYPGAVWFSPADSDRSVGWSTTDAATAVTGWFSQSLGTEAMDVSQWQRYQAEQAMQQFDQTAIARMQALMEKAFKGDKAAMAEYEKLAKDIDSNSNAAKDAADKSLGELPLPPDSVITDARWIIGKKKGTRASTLVVVYPIAGLQRTVIQAAWDLTDYPGACPVGD